MSDQIQRYYLSALLICFGGIGMADIGMQVGFGNVNFWFSIVCVGLESLLLASVMGKIWNNPNGSSAAN